jgi:hypothetical protein
VRSVVVVVVVTLVVVAAPFAMPAAASVWRLPGCEP